MQLLPILLVAALMAVDGGLRPIGADWGLSHAQTAALTCGSIALALLAMAVAIWWCEHRLKRGDVHAIISADRMGRALRLVVVFIHLAAVLVLDWLGAVRSVLGDWVLLDELAALAPTLLGLIGTWYLFYPIERRLHQAGLIRQLDEGRPLYPPLSRGRYVLMQVRMQLLLTLVPVLLIALISEALAELGESTQLPHSSEWMLPLGKVAAAAGVFIFAPLLARVLLDVTPMAQGELRDSLLEVCRRQNVRIRELLVWNTNGTVFNAAVMGLVGPLRYVLITDALLESMSPQQVRAVMAHEIGHVRRHHMPWMVVALLACFAIADYSIRLPFIAAYYAGLGEFDPTSDAFTLSIGSAQLIVALAVFGWICRRFERQADTFAVQHLSREEMQEMAGALTFSDGPYFASGAITPQAVYTMSSALHSICRLNMIDPDRPSWRHGSIMWRVNYLRSIIGLPASNLRIDRTVGWLKITCAAVLLLASAHALAEALRWGPFA